MKKRILALLLAGLITASMASCVSSAGRETPTGGTENTQSRAPAPEQTDPPAVVIWDEVNETVYVTATNLSLIGVDNSTQTVKVSQMTMLNRTAKGSNGKSIVEKDGVKYYADSKSLTNADLTGLGFETCDPTTMYVASDDVAVRKYATKDYSFSTVIELMALNDTVTVIAKSENWYMIKYDNDNNYFVSATWLSDKFVVDANDINNYPKFEDLATADRFSLYVVADSLTLRYCPSFDAKAVDYLLKGAELTVVAQQTVEDTLWYKVIMEVQGSGGASHDNLVGYVAQSKYVSTDKTDSANITLDDVLAVYSEFTKTESAQTMYVSADSLNVRMTPEFPEDNGNLVTAMSLVNKDEVKVVATGMKGDTFWAIINPEEGKFYFVSYKWLTPNSDGTPAPMGLDQLLATYTDFDLLEAEKTMYAKSTVNCNTMPANQDEVDKKLAAGDAVTVVAEGEVRYKTWYLFRTADGLYFFASADMFSTTNSAS